jgi:hypothetical protein
MIDVTAFLESHDLGLFGPAGMCRESPTDEFAQFFLKGHAELDVEHLRCALLILSSVDNAAIRAIAKACHNHPDVGVGHAAGVFFHRQLEQGYIPRMTWQDWIALK